MGSSAHVLVVDDDRGQVLSGLLEVRFPTTWPSIDGGLVTALADQHGLRALVREPLDLITVVMVAAPGQPAPAGHRWIAPAALPAARPSVDRYLTGGYWRPPWYQPGWFSDARAYLDRVLARIGREPTGAWQQIKQWSLSAVLRQPTVGGDVYLKAGLPAHAVEPHLTAWLAGQGVGPFGVILDHDAATGRWVTDDFGGRSGGPPDQDLIVASLARLQLAMVDRREELAAIGCPPRSLADLSAGLVDGLARDDLWAAPPSLATGHRTLPPGGVARLMDLGPRLADDAARLAGFGLPDTLVHGDFHVGNAVLRPDGVLLHDFSFAALAHPMLDLGWPFYDGPPDEAQATVDQWMASWSAAVDPATLRRAWAVAGPLAVGAELTKFLGLIDLVGPAHAFNFLPVVYGWARRLLKATACACCGTYLKS